MAHLYIAYIPPQHYDAFQRILQGNLPNTYDEWSEVHMRKAADILDAGDIYREVQIDPDEFAGACGSDGVDRTLQGLDRFAGLKARKGGRII